MAFHACVLCLVPHQCSLHAHGASLLSPYYGGQALLVRAAQCCPILRYPCVILFRTENWLATNEMTGSSLLEAGASLDERIRAIDWPKSCLGAIENWPESLRAAFSICLGTRLPNAVFWGVDAVMLYNDASCALLGDEHPSAIGRPATEGCPGLWSRFGPHVDRVLASGEPVHVANWLFSLKRHGSLEERYFDCSFAPIRGAAGRIEGVFSAMSETTGRVASAFAVAQDDGEQGALDFTRQHEKAEVKRRRLHTLLRDLPATINLLRGPELVFEFAHPLTIAALGGRNVTGLPLLQAIPEYAGQAFPALLRRVLDTGVPYRCNETLARIDSTGLGKLEDSYWNVVYLPVRGPDGAIEGIMTFDVEVTEMVLARRRVEALLKELETNDRTKDDFLAMLGHEAAARARCVTPGRHSRSANREPRSHRRRTARRGAGHAREARAAGGAAVARRIDRSRGRFGPGPD